MWNASSKAVQSLNSIQKPLLFTQSANSTKFIWSQHGSLKNLKNQEVDELSRLASKDNYMLNPNSLTALDILWGPHTIDRFCTSRTCQVPRFCSCWLNQCTEAKDAFTLDWSEGTNWIFPPPYMIPKVLKHMEHGREMGTLVIPLWTSASWWAVCTTDGTLPEEFVRD